MKYLVTIEIKASPERVFQWLDGGERVKRWLPNLVENVDLHVTPQKVGSRFRHVYAENGRSMEMTGTVTAYEANKRLSCSLHGDLFELVVDYSLQDLGGRTRLTQKSDIRFKSAVVRAVMVVLQPFTRRAAQRRADQSFAELARLAESASEGAA